MRWGPPAQVVANEAALLGFAGLTAPTSFV